MKTSNIQKYWSMIGAVRPYASRSSEKFISQIDGNLSVGKVGNIYFVYSGDMFTPNPLSKIIAEDICEPETLDGFLHLTKFNNNYYFAGIAHSKDQIIWRNSYLKLEELKMFVFASVFGNGETL